MRSSRFCTALLIAVLVLSGCGAASTVAPTIAAGATQTTRATSSPPALPPQGPGATCSYPTAGAAAKPATAPPGIEPSTGSVTVTVGLTGGDVTIVMDRSKTPCTIGSFAHLATAGYFNGTPCHRLTTSDSLKVLQCGDPSGQGTGGPGYSFADETDASMTYQAGTIAMANSGPNTNGSQFFLVYGDSQLPPNYTVFGHITGGMGVLDKIAAAGVSGGTQDGAPATRVSISKVAVG